MSWTIDQWLEKYGESHQNPINKQIHWVCVPLIMMSLIGMLWGIRVPGVDWEYANLGTLLIVGATAWYLRLSPRLALGMGVVTAGMLAGLYLLSSLPFPLWATCAVIFAGAWVFQFVGHKIEGKKPSFLEDLFFLLVGPMWLLSFVYKSLGLKY